MNKITFTYAYGNSSFTESFYTPKGFADISQNELRSVINTRLDLCASFVRCVDVRWSNENDSIRYARHYKMPTVGIPGRWRAEGEETSVNSRNNAILVQMTADGLSSHRSMSLLGIPDHVVIDDKIDPLYEEELDNKLQLLLITLDQTLGAVHRKMAADNTAMPIKSFVAQTAEEPNVRIVVAPDAELEQQLPEEQSVITIRGCKPYGDLNRKFRVIEVNQANNTLTLAGTKYLRCVGKAEAGEVLLPQYLTGKFTHIRIVRVTSRKTAAPFGLPRGRRSKVSRP